MEPFVSLGKQWVGIGIGVGIWAIGCLVAGIGYAIWGGWIIRVVVTIRCALYFCWGCWVLFFKVGLHWEGWYLCFSKKSDYLVDRESKWGLWVVGSKDFESLLPQTHALCHQVQRGFFFASLAGIKLA